MHSYSKTTKLVVLQPTSFCNIDCKYCYVPDRRVKDIMTADILEETLKKLLTSTMLADDTRFLWHSGEPLSVGIPFYKRIVKLIEQYNIHKVKVFNAIQTNATLINQEWCEFFKEYGFEPGISLDGPDFLHDSQRIMRNGKGTHSKVMRGIELLKKNNFKVSVLCVVSKLTLDYPHALFNFFLDNGIKNVSLILEETIGENKLNPLHTGNMKTVSPEIRKKYAVFINTIFQLWLKNKDKISIREFVLLSVNMYKLKNDPAYEPIPEESQAFKIISIQKNGDISTFCPELAGGTKENRNIFTIGNIKTIQQLDDITHNENFLKMLASINKGIDNCRKSCDYFKLCGGRSPAIKMYENNSFESTVTQHCILHRQTLAETVTNAMLGMQ